MHRLRGESEKFAVIFVDRDLPEAQKLSRLQKAHRSASSITSFGSQVGDTRPLSSCNFSPNSGTVQYFVKCTEDLSDIRM